MAGRPADAPENGLHRGSMWASAARSLRMRTLASQIGLGLAARDDLSDVVEWARRARDNGLNSLWIHDSYYERDAVTFATAVAGGIAADKRPGDASFRVALGAVNIFTRHPVVLAM